jgi:3-oxoacyl-[acyl-carrier protein] reductase
VAVNYASSRSSADRVAAGITSKGGKAIAVRADVSTRADIQRLFAETKKGFGRLDVLVNNAGIYGFAPLEEVTGEHFHWQFDLNVLGLLLPPVPHDSWVVGDEPYVSLHLLGTDRYAT